MTELKGLYTLWLREVKRYLRNRTRILSSFMQPFLWLVIFGVGIGSSLRGALPTPELTYQELIFPGILGQTLLFTSMFMGISVIWDKEFGFMKEILVSPLSRFTIFMGKMLGDSTDSLIQGLIVIALGLVLGINITPIAVLLCLPVMLLTTFGLVSIGLIIASFMDNLESFGAIQSFINLPLFFLSGALFQLQSLPTWLQDISKLNPLTYGVDALRHVILGATWQPLQVQPLLIDIAIVCIFDLFMIIAGTWAFHRMK
ncbi:MAG: ABC transporter permease [Candidatus Bathyarchaeota archaeon]|nr:ABC transporter permease [Candidatus Bathyarchaeota archaeon]